MARFWAELLGRQVVDEDDGVLLPGDERQSGLRFVAGSTQKVGLDRLHLHLTSAGPEGQRATVEKALSIGGCHLDVGQLPEEGHVVLSDPGDDEFCVIEAGKRFPRRMRSTRRGRLRRFSRMRSLGATRLADLDEGVELADPDGNEFRIVGHREVPSRSARDHRRVAPALRKRGSDHGS